MSSWCSPWQATGRYAHDMRTSYGAGIGCAVVSLTMVAKAQRPAVSGQWVAVPAEAPANLLVAPSAMMGKVGVSRGWRDCLPHPHRA